ncbi:MAG: cytochrome c [Pseudomonadota bacterium]
MFKLSAAAVMVAFVVAPGAIAKEKSKPPVPFTEAFLSDQANLDEGREIWGDQCAHCHGAKAYPGKAPKLKPRKYKPDFVYRRVTDGFRKMPAWIDVYSDEERMAITAYIMSNQFSP